MVVSASLIHILTKKHISQTNTNVKWGEGDTKAPGRNANPDNVMDNAGEENSRLHLQ